LSLGNWSSQAVQLVSKIVTALTLYVGARLVIAGELTVGELIAFNMLQDEWLNRCCGWRNYGKTSIRHASPSRGSAISEYDTRTHLRCCAAALPPIRGNITFEHIMFRYGLMDP